MNIRPQGRPPTGTQGHRDTGIQGDKNRDNELGREAALSWWERAPAREYQPEALQAVG
jgi:hypothetical protein